MGYDWIFARIFFVFFCFWVPLSKAGPLGPHNAQGKEQEEREDSPLAARYGDVPDTGEARDYDQPQGQRPPTPGMSDFFLLARPASRGHTPALPEAAYLPSAFNRDHEGDASYFRSPSLISSHRNAAATLTEDSLRCHENLDEDDNSQTGNNTQSQPNEDNDLSIPARQPSFGGPFTQFVPETPHSDIEEGAARADHPFVENLDRTRLRNMQRKLSELSNQVAVLREVVERHTELLERTLIQFRLLRTEQQIAHLLGGAGGIDLASLLSQEEGFSDQRGTPSQRRPMEKGAFTSRSKRPCGRKPGRWQRNNDNEDDGDVAT